MKNKIRILSGCLIFSFSAIYILYAFSGLNSQRKNGFTRIFKDIIRPAGELRLDYAGFYIAGVSTRHIYLGDYLRPTHLLILNQELSDMQHVKLKVPASIRFAWKLAKLFVDSPVIRLAEGITPCILEGSLPRSDLHESKYPDLYFTVALPISSLSLLVKCNDRNSGQDILVKETNENKYFHAAKNILEKQIDGIFCVDGLMLAEAGSNRIFYVYFYRNQFICLDTNLNILYKKNTIDTNTTAKITVSSFRNNTASTFSSPPFTVNKYACLSKDWILIKSDLQADNEDKEKFARASVIDLYSARDGIYQFSFYLPDSDSEKAKSFSLSGDLLIALYDHAICTYHLLP